MGVLWGQRLGRYVIKGKGAGVSTEAASTENAFVSVGSVERGEKDGPVRSFGNKVSILRNQGIRFQSRILGGGTSCRFAMEKRASTERTTVCVKRKVRGRFPSEGIGQNSRGITLGGAKGRGELGWRQKYRWGVDKRKRGRRSCLERIGVGERPAANDSLPAYQVVRPRGKKRKGGYKGLRAAGGVWVRIRG